MAAKKKKKTKKASRSAKAKKSPARKSKAKKAGKRPARKAPVKKAAASTKALAARKKAPAKKKKQTVGEGDYAASRSFFKDQSSFVEKNKANIPAMGEAAEVALDGPEGAALREAEATAAARSRDTF